MATFKPHRGKEANLETNVPLQDGNFIITTDTHKIYVDVADVDNSDGDIKRIMISGLANNGIFSMEDDKGVTKDVIKVYNPSNINNPDQAASYGSELIIGTGGNTFVGSGESPDYLRKALQEQESLDLNDFVENRDVYSVQGENTFISADSDIILYSGCNESTSETNPHSIKDRKGLIWTSNGNLYPLIKNPSDSQSCLGLSSYPWKSIHVENSYATKFNIGTNGEITSSGSRHIKISNTVSNPSNESQSVRLVTRYPNNSTDDAHLIWQTSYASNGPYSALYPIDNKSATSTAMYTHYLGTSGSPWEIGYINTVHGNADTADKLKTPVTLTIGNVSRQFDGSDNVAWTLEDIGANTNVSNVYYKLTDIGIDELDDPVNDAPIPMKTIATKMPANSMLVLDSRDIIYTSVTNDDGHWKIADLGSTTAGMYVFIKGNTFARISLLHINGSTAATDTLIRYGCYAYNNETTIWESALPLSNTILMMDDRGKTKNVLRLINNPWPIGDDAEAAGNDLLISAGGNTFIGSGESHQHLYEALSGKKPNTGEDSTAYEKFTYEISGDAKYDSQSEKMYIASDFELMLYSGCNTMDNRKSLIFDKNGYFYPLQSGSNLGTDAHKWANVYAEKGFYVGNGKLIASTQAITLTAPESNSESSSVQLRANFIATDDTATDINLIWRATNYAAALYPTVTHPYGTPSRYLGLSSNPWDSAYIGTTYSNYIEPFSTTAKAVSLNLQAIASGSSSTQSNDYNSGNVILITKASCKDTGVFGNLSVHSATLRWGYEAASKRWCLVPLGGANNSNTGYYCGSSTYKWDAIYAVSGTIQTSDKASKDSIRYLINESQSNEMMRSINNTTTTRESASITVDNIINFISNLDPVTFCYKNDAEIATEENSKPESIQLGLIADEIQYDPLFKYIGVKNEYEEVIVPEELDENGNIIAKAITETKTSFGLQAIPLATTALTACKYLLNKITELETHNLELENRILDLENK